MPYSSSTGKLPAERASRLGHLDVLKSKLVTQLCSSFENPQLDLPTTAAKWVPANATGDPLPLVFGVDGSLQVIRSEIKPYKTIGFVKTAMVMLDRPALSKVNKDAPHPFVLRDILQDSQIYHATAFPLRHIAIPGKTLYDAVRTVIFDSMRDPSLQGEVFETFKWLAYEKWSSANRHLPEFQCPHCESDKCTLPYDADQGPCPVCNKEVLVTDMLGFHQVMAEDAAPDAIASDYMGVHETMLLFTGIRHFWLKDKATLAQCLFVKDGPLSVRAQYSKLVNPIRRFLKHAAAEGIEVCLVGQEKSGTFWDHLEVIGDQSPSGSIFIPDDLYIKSEIQNRPSGGAKYGKDTNYGAKTFYKHDERMRFVLNIPNGDNAEPQNSALIGLRRILATIPLISSVRFENGLLPIELAHSVASLSTYPSAKVLKMFADAAKAATA